MSASIKQKISALYLLTFLFSLHGALPLYVNSSFLGTRIPEGLIGLVYVVASIISVIALVWTPPLLAQLGNYKTTLLFLFLQIGITFFIAHSAIPVIGLALLILHIVIFRIIGYNLDLFLERYSTDAETGGIRGAFLTIGNIAILTAPLLAGFIIGDNQFERIYMSSTLLLIPVIYLLTKHFKTFRDLEYKRIPLWSTIRKTYTNKNIYNIMLVNLLLRFFYAWMVIYMPIYLNQHIGFSWGHIGIMFSIMLLPFVLFEVPLGKLADTRYGEKEILTIGFIIMALTTASLAFLNTQNIILWTSMLFLTRTGASMVEIMMESYFFKHIDGSDSPTLSLFRIMQPTAYILAPLAASALLYLIDFKYLFIVLGFIMLYGIRHSINLIDTK